MQMMKVAILSLIVLTSTLAHEPIHFEVDVETRSENEPIQKDHSNDVWLQTNPHSSISKMGFKEGTISARGLTFRNSKKEIITCTASGVSTQLKDGKISDPKSAQPRFQPKEMKCIDSQKAEEMRFRKDPSLREKLATPHGAFGGWMPYNPNLHMVDWSQPISSYMMSYQGVYGCSVHVSGATHCPPTALLGPYAMQSPGGLPFFLPPGVVDQMPFVPAPAEDSGAKK